MKFHCIDLWLAVKIIKSLSHQYNWINRKKWPILISCRRGIVRIWHISLSCSNQTNTLVKFHSLSHSLSHLCWTCHEKARGTQNVRLFTPRLHLSRCQFIHSKNRLDRLLFLFKCLAECAFLCLSFLSLSLNPLHLYFNLPRFAELFLLKHDLSAENLSHYLFDAMFYVFFRYALTCGD